MQVDEKMIPPEAVEAAAKAIAESMRTARLTMESEDGYKPEARAAIAAALEAWKPSWIETEFDNAGVIISRHYVLDITPEDNPND